MNNEIEKRFQDFGAAIRRVDEPVDYDRLSKRLQDIIAKLQVEVDELRFESGIYRWVSVATLYLVGERVWRYLFS